MRFLGFFTLVLGLLCGVYDRLIHFVDPYGEHGAGKFPVVVLDSRRAKLQLLHRYSQEGPVNGVILGSSRSLLMPPEVLSAGGARRVFNFAVDNGHAEDFLAIYHYVSAQRNAPNFLVVGLDVVSLHEDNIHDPMFERSDLKNYLGDGTVPRSTPLDFLMDWKTEYQWNDLKDSCKAMEMKALHQVPKTAFRADGYEQQFSGAPLPLVVMPPDHDFGPDVKSYVERLAGMRNLSSVRLGYLKQLFAEARQRHTLVVVWLTPIHPQLHQSIVQATNYASLIDKINEEAKTWTAAFGIHYHDYTDIAAFGGSEADWNDATHMNGRNIALAARALANEIQ
jgi:hypothetical protein